MEPIRILLVDDHDLFRRGVRSIITAEPDMEVVGEASNGEEAIRLAKEQMPDIILMDLNMPHRDGLQATRFITQQFPYVKIIMLTVSEGEENLFEAIKAGAQGYLIKNVEPQQLLDAVRRAYRGEATLPSDLAVKILAEFAHGQRTAQAGDPIEPLGERELDVLRELARGLANKEIAAVLCISEHTVRNHVKNILSKLHLNNRVQAAIYAIREGIASP